MQAYCGREFPLLALKLASTFAQSIKEFGKLSYRQTSGTTANLSFVDLKATLQFVSIFDIMAVNRRHKCVKSCVTHTRTVKHFHSHFITFSFHKFKIIKRIHFLYNNINRTRTSEMRS